MRLSVRILALIVVLLAGPVRAADGPAYVLVDVTSGTVLDSRQPDHLWQPASLTKLMTVYLTFSALKSGKLTLTSPVKISAHALAQAPAKMGFSVGTILNVDNALKMTIVKSANDIAMALAETVGGSESGFVAMMNAEAQRLGMTATHYDNPNGLPDDGQLTTARDLAVLARAVWLDFPEYRYLFGIPAIRAGKRILRSQNKLLEQYHGTNGMKTGFVCASGFNMVASANRFGRQLMVVVLGAGSSGDRAEMAAGLLNQGFGNLFAGAGSPDACRFQGRARCRTGRRHERPGLRQAHPQRGGGPGARQPRAGFRARAAIPVDGPGPGLYGSRRPGARRSCGQRSGPGGQGADATTSAAATGRPRLCSRAGAFANDARHQAATRPHTLGLAG